MADFQIREGATEPIGFILQEISNGLPVTLDLNSIGATAVALYRRDKAETEDVFASTDATPQIEIATAADGLVTLSPTGTDFLKANEPYQCYFVITGASGKTYHFPSNRRFMIEVVDKNS